MRGCGNQGSLPHSFGTLHVFEKKERLQTKDAFGSDVTISPSLRPSCKARHSRWCRPAAGLSRVLSPETPPSRGTWWRKWRSVTAWRCRSLGCSHARASCSIQSSCRSRNSPISDGRKPNKIYQDDTEFRVHAKEEIIRYLTGENRTGFIR